MTVPVITTPTDADVKVSAASRRADECALRTRDRFHRGTLRWVILLIVSFGALLMTVPFILMLLNAFKSPADYSVNGPLSWPTEFYTKGLVTYWNEVNYPQKLWNSTVIAGTVAVDMAAPAIPAVPSDSTPMTTAPITNDLAAGMICFMVDLTS